MSGNGYEIERKWMVSGWPDMPLEMEKRQYMRQGYVNVEPTVRIREEAEDGRTPEYILCLKSPGTLVRREIEFPIQKEYFDQIEEMIGYPLIPKERRTYRLPGDLRLEVNLVDEGMPTMFWYAEVEFADEDQARQWQPASAGIEAYLKDEVTGEPGQSMGAYWIRTRLSE